MNKLVLAVTMMSATAAGAQTTEMPPPQSTIDPSVSPYAPPEEAKKEPQRGDFDFGGQARFPNGPDEAGDFASFNWIAMDLKGRYYLLKTVTANLNVPIAIIKPDTVMTPAGGMLEPSTFGGFTANIDARLPLKKGSFPLMRFDTDVGLALTLGYMREGAMLLSEKDYPLFVGDLKPGVGLGLITKLKMSSVLDFSLLPTWVYQSGTDDSLQAVQIPLALGIGLGSLLKVNLELGVYTGDDYSFSGDEGGRIATGASLDLKIGPMLFHLGAGVASLLTGGVYPTISDSVYVDVNAKYVK